ncbi:hypothetical protein DP115_13375 [Brasilonema octagenarum UFV-OR1]|uniref:Transposase n=1 Tax=Brasilonema octagenarum UFV-OR1 TaxID=417115 RepID=A0ABX1M9E6_9CYAN|nr:hypothetical protein [Brasilonema octagenarum UFV-OR1]
MNPPVLKWLQNKLIFSLKFCKFNYTLAGVNRFTKDTSLGCLVSAMLIYSDFHLFEPLFFIGVQGIAPRRVWFIYPKTAVISIAWRF